MIEEIDFLDVSKEKFKDVIDGKIFKVKNHSLLKNFIKNFRKKFELSEINNLDFKEFEKLNNHLSNERLNLNIANIFRDFIFKIKSTENEFLQIEQGMLRLYVYDDLNKKEIDNSSENFNEANKRGLYPKSFITNIKASPHRDLDRPHYSRQFNIWFSFFDLQKEDSLIFFPESFKKDIKPKIGDDKNVDTNRDNLLIQRKSKLKDYKNFCLGAHESCNLEVGDFLLFNSEQFHCSPIKKSNRVSCEVRFVENCFDNNKHYRSEGFVNITNLLDKNYFEKQYINLVDDTFDDLSKYGFDLVLERIERTKRNQDNEKKIFKILEYISRKTKNFYILEKIIKLNYFNNFKKFQLVLKYNYLSFIFYIKYFSFKKNPINYFAKNHHEFTQAIPKISLMGKLFNKF